MGINMKNCILKKSILSLFLLGGWNAESYGAEDEEFLKALEESKIMYEKEIAQKADNQYLEDEFLAWTLQESENNYVDVDQDVSLVSQIKHFQNTVHSKTGIKLIFEKNDEDTLFFVKDDQLGHEYGYGNHPLVRENSSGKENCCLLFSIIGENEDLLTKVLGNNRQQAQAILANPELADMCDEDAADLGLKRRDFSDVRGKFMKDVLEAMETGRTFYLENGEERSVKDYVEALNSVYPGVIVDPKGLHENGRCIPVEYATLFSVLYDTPVCPLAKENKKTPILLNPLIRDKGFGQRLMPYFTKDEWKKAIFIYHSGYHYQKLHRLDD